MKRLGIYVTYDPENKVDDYIDYMLRELRIVVDCLVVVCNYAYIAKGIENIHPYADKVYYRDNIGYDAGGFKDAICNLLGWDKVYQYDELLLTNDSMFGPFYPMKDIFKNMSEKEADFWGLTKYKERIYEAYGKMAHVPEHIQSFFLVFRSRLLHSDLFRELWETMPYYGSFNEVVEEYEMKLTAFLEKSGYRYICYADMKINETDNIRNNYNQYGFIANELVRKRNFPFLKKKAIIYTTLNQQTQENIPLVLDYIKYHTDYDINLIYENCIRLMNVSDLQRKLCLNYILDNQGKGDKKDNYKVVIAVLVEYENSFEYVMEYLDSVSDRCDIYILSVSDAILNLYREKGFQCFTASDDYKISIIDKLSESDFVCVVHDSDMSSDRVPSYIGKSKFYSVWENLISSRDYIANVIDVFEKNEKLGLLVAPSANFGRYFGESGTGWNDRFGDICKVVEKYHIRCNLDYTKPPFEKVHDYWVRGKLLACIRSGKNDFFELLPWTWIYVAQSEGYLSGIVESVNYARMNEINKQYYLDTICAQIREQVGVFSDFEELQRLLSKKAVMEYCQKYESVYVYGTGKIAEAYSSIMPNIKAYVVSDNQQKLSEFCSKKVIYLSEMKNVGVHCQTGLVVCLDKKKQAQVLPKILERGFKDYLCVS